MRIFKGMLIGVVATVSLYGCGANSSDQFVFTSTAPTVSTVRGQFFLGTPVGDAQVALQDASGQTVGAGTTRNDGTFLLSTSVPTISNLTVVARPKGSDALFFSEIRPNSKFTYVNVPTTLAHLVRQADGGSIEQADARVRVALGIPANTPLAAYVSETTALSFSHLAFFRAADNAGGWRAFSEPFVQQLSNQGSSRTGPFRLNKTMVAVPFRNLEPGLLELAESARVRTVVFESSSTGGAGSFLLSLTKKVGEGAFETIVSGPIGDFVAEEVWTWIGSQFGFNWGTTEKLNEIIEELGEVLNELDLIQSELVTAALDQRIQNLQSDVGDIKTVTQALSSIPNTTDITNQPQTPSGEATAVLNQLAAVNLTNEMGAIHQALSGPDNSFDAYRAFIVEKLGLDAPSRFAELPWRSYTLNGQLNDFLGYYQGYQTLALNAELEGAHSSPTGSTGQGATNPNLAEEINGLIPTVREVLANQKLQGQQMVPTFPTDQVIIDLENGLMWYRYGQNAETWSSALAKADQFEVYPDPENNPDLVYRDWRLPTYAECQTLQRRGAFSQDKDQTLPSSDSKKDGIDYGLCVQGLPALGFVIPTKSDPNDPTRQVPDIQPHGGIWVDMYARGAFNREEGEVYEAASVEFRLNDIDKDNEYKAPENGKGYENPFFIVRSIGKPLLPWLTDYNGSAPAWSLVSPIHSIPELPPELAKYQAITAAEAPYLGVPTSLQLKQGPSVNSLIASVTYAVYVGGEYTLGSGETTKTESVPAPEPAQFEIERNQAAVFSAPRDTAEALIPAEVSNLTGEEGSVFWHPTFTPATPSVSFVAKLLGYSNNSYPESIEASLTVSNSDPAPRTLNSFLVMPQNILNSDKSLPNYQFRCTGFFNDRSIDDLTNSATWSVSGAPAGVSITSAGILELPDSFSTSEDQVTFTVTATFVSGGVTFTSSTQFATVTN